MSINQHYNKERNTIVIHLNKSTNEHFKDVFIFGTQIKFFIENQTKTVLNPKL